MTTVSFILLKNDRAKHLIQDRTSMIYVSLYSKLGNISVGFFQNKMEGNKKLLVMCQGVVFLKLAAVFVTEVFPCDSTLKLPFFWLIWTTDIHRHPQVNHVVFKKVNIYRRFMQNTKNVIGFPPSHSKRFITCLKTENGTIDLKATKKCLVFLGLSLPTIIFSGSLLTLKKCLWIFI